MYASFQHINFIRTKGSNGINTRQVLLHSPFEYPNDNIDETILSAGRMMLVSVYPEKFDTTQGVRNIDVQSRKCLRKSERALESLQQYSYSNCYAECRQNLSAHLCGCSPFYYPNNCKYQSYEGLEKKLVKKLKKTKIKKVKYKQLFLTFMEPCIIE